MKPKTISEKAMYATVLIETNTGRGTGFFFSFKIDENYSVPIIITNKHVVNNNVRETVTVSFHLIDENEECKENIKVTSTVEWYQHSNKDLCFCYAMVLLHIAKVKSKKEVFFVPITEDIVYDNEKLEGLGAIEDVMMVGYPIGLSDEKNNFPIFRKGITASHPALDFNEQGISVIDTACFPGSSGSPIFILNESVYAQYTGEKKGIHLNSRVIFLGILFAGPTLNVTGNIEIVEIPTQQKPIATVPIMINLGYYIKANEILEFRKLVEEKIKPEITMLKDQEKNK